MMERLTGKFRGRTGLVDYLNVSCNKICNRSFCEDCPIEKAFEKLAHYEDLEEQGLLLKLPCKVGTLVYEAYCLKSGISGVNEHRLILEDIPKFNKTVFLTKEEAEAKLKELENERFN